jgi:glycosyltransferase involved in cell wall biosynthesis
VKAVDKHAAPALLPAASKQSGRIRLLQFLNVFGVGGTERQVTNLIRRLDPSRFDVRIGCFARWGEFLEEIEQRSLPIAEYRIRSLYKPVPLKQQLRLCADLRRDGIQILHSYNFYANLFSLPPARLAGVPVTIASIRDIGVYLTAAQKRAQAFACRFVDCVLVNADAIRRWLIGQGCDAEKIAVIRNGIDLSKFTGTRDGERLRGELGVPAHAPLVITLCRLNPQKGIEDFLEAASIVHRRHPDARFLIVGDAFIRDGDEIVPETAYRQSLLRQVERLGLGRHVVFTGFRTDVPELLAEASVSVLPSHSEGLSNTLLESMAAGVPVVATRVGGTPEAIEHGVGGLLVAPHDAAALAEAISAILANDQLARGLAEHGRRRVRASFSLERMVRDTEALYARLLEARTLRAGRMQFERYGTG